jgi:hypothetical protein
MRSTSEQVMMQGAPLSTQDVGTAGQGAEPGAHIGERDGGDAAVNTECFNRTGGGARRARWRR